jgi:hypothetical protein
LAWRETEERVVELDSGTDRVPVAFGIPRDIWNPSSILSREINLPLAEAAPNLLVGVGLLMTFLFLTVAVTSATDALQPGPTAGNASPARAPSSDWREVHDVFGWPARLDCLDCLCPQVDGTAWSIV